MLYGEHDQHLLRIEQQLGVSLASRGNRLAISGPPASVEAANAALTALYQRLKKGLDVGAGAADAVARMAMQASDASGPQDLIAKAIVPVLSLVAHVPHPAEIGRGACSGSVSKTW